MINLTDVGLHMAVFLISTYYVVKAPATGKISWTFLSLLIGFIIVGTLQVASEARFGELIWIDNRGYTGGPVAWYHSHYNDPSNILGLGSFIFGNFLADGVLVSAFFSEDFLLNYLNADCDHTPAISLICYLG